MKTLQPITTAPKDGTPVLLKVKPDQGAFSNLVFVGRNRNDSAEWCFAAPVGCGGIPDSWLVGWMPLAESRPPEADSLRPYGGCARFWHSPPLSSYSERVKV